MANHQELSSLIWNVCDDVLRGLFKPHEYGDIILPFVVLRRLDCVLEPNKDKAHELYNTYKDILDDPTPVLMDELKTQFFNHSKYDLARLKQDPKNISINFKDYIKGFSKNVYDIIENFQIQKPVEKLERNNKLYLFIEKFTAVDLHPEVVDNHAMGQIFEELLRRFSEMSNETSGEHYTPRDVVQLLVALLFSGSEDDLKGEGKIRSLFDPCCGTGGMLTIGKKWVLENMNPGIDISLSGQELNPQTYSICKSDMLISGENPDSIRLGSSLSMDAFPDSKFEYMLTNPPFGVSWKGEEEFVKDEARDHRGRFFAGTPRTSDGSLLFLQHMISKMEPNGSRIGIIFNGSPLFTGDAGSGESEIRKWIIENDMLECIVQLPDSLFFNTDITTYIWLVTNRKEDRRKGKIQLICVAELSKPLKKLLGKKSKYIAEDQRKRILNAYLDFRETEICKIFPNTHFGYTKVTIEQPLIVDDRPVSDKNGNLKPDVALRDYERIPLDIPVAEYYEREVLPYLPQAWMNHANDVVGYKMNFLKYFHKSQPLRSLSEISEELLNIDKEKEKLNALINSAVTNGLDPDVKMKFSGVEWIGEIPEHWEVLRIKYFTKLVQIKSEDGSEELLSVSEHRGIIPRRYIKDETEELTRAESLIGYLKVKKGDLVCNIMLMWKRGLGVSDYEGIVSPAYSVFEFEKGNPKYFHYLFRTDMYTSEFKRNSTGVIESRLRLYSDEFGNLYSHFPPLSEQDQIVESLEQGSHTIDTLVSLEQKKIDLLKEYRQALISEAVTGKIK